MSNGHWRTQKQKQLSSCGKGITPRVSAYITTWKNRCYFDDIPDRVPKKLADSMRAPSYKAIAIAILKNDNRLRSLGFGDEPPDVYWQLRRLNSEQKDMFT